MSARIFPATDLHLLPGTTVDLRFFNKAHGVWTDLTTLPGFTASVESMTDGAVADYVTPRVTAKAAGTTVIRLELAETAGPLGMLVFRTTVHQTLTRLFVPRSAITVEAHRTDRVLTVYAELDDGGVKTTADITNHPYLTYRVTTLSGSPGVTVPAGRVVTVAGTGKVKVEIGIDPALGLNVAPVAVELDVVNPVTDRPILEAVHRGTAVRTRAIVFLGDGFTAADQPMFDALVEDVTRQLWKLSPLTLLKESFDVYRAFTASDEAGCTIGPHVMPSRTPDVGWSRLPDQGLTRDSMLVFHLVFGLQHPQLTFPGLGLPGDPGAPTTLAQARTATHTTTLPVLLPQTTFDAWRDLPAAKPTRVRETVFGQVLGGRAGGTAARSSASIAARAELDLLGALSLEPNRTPVFDERRLPDLAVAGADPLRAHETAFNAFLGTLRPAGGPLGFGKRWVTAPVKGADAGLVVMLINADHYGGTRRDECVTLSIGGGIQHRTSPSTVVPGLLEVAPVARPIELFSPASVDGFRERPVMSLADRVAHELGHSAAFGELNDEYAKDSDGAPPDLTSAGFQRFVEAAPNTQMLAAVRTANQHVDGSLLKWGRWPRIEGAAVPELLGGTGQLLQATLVLEDWVAWPALAVGRRVVLRGRNLATNLPAPVELVFRAADPTLQRLELDVPAGTTAELLRTTFVDGATLVVPRVDTANQPIGIVDPSVVAELLATGPFGASGAGCVANANPSAPFITGIGFWRLRDLVGAYEAAAGSDCGVVRAVLECKMRTVVDMFERPTEFCFVCKYVIVDAIAPRAHALLDREYPT